MLIHEPNLKTKEMMWPVHEHESKGGAYNRVHLLIMALGCIIPIAIIIAIFYSNIDSSYLPLLLILMCPLLMLLMHLPRTLSRKNRAKEDSTFEHQRGNTVENRNDR